MHKSALHTGTLFVERYVAQPGTIAEIGSAVATQVFG